MEGGRGTAGHGGGWAWHSGPGWRVGVAQRARVEGGRGIVGQGGGWAWHSGPGWRVGVA